MIRKENIDVKELNRRIHSRAQLKPSLDAFPVKDVSVPFNSLRNTHGIMNAELEVPSSFQENNTGVANQIKEIKENENLKLNIEEPETVNVNTKEVDKLLDDIAEEIETEDEMIIEGNNNSIDDNNFPMDSNANNQPINNNLHANVNPSPVSTNIYPPSAKVNTKPEIDNKLIRSIMDIKRNTILNKSLMVAFLILIAVLVYFGLHKKLF